MIIPDHKGQITPPASFGPVPTEQQLTWHELEQYAFIHFTTNTFTNKEWGFGDESGFAGETNWCIINPDTLFAGKSGIENLLNAGSEDGTQWIPAEVDVSIRPGWFYHPEQDSLVKTPEQLFEIYLNSVGRGSNLLLNIPPDRRGLLHENDIESLLGFKRLLDQAFENNLAGKATVTASTFRGHASQYSPEHLIDNNQDTYWATDDSITAADIVIDLGNEKSVHYIQIQEYIKLGQRIRSFQIDIKKDEDWVNMYSGTTIGYKRIISINSTHTRKIRISVTDSKACPVISNVEVY